MAEASSYGPRSEERCTNLRFGAEFPGTSGTSTGLSVLGSGGN